MAYAVPNVAGVPALLGGFVPGFGAGVALLAEDALGALSAVPALWGIFQGGAPVVVADTVSAFDAKQEWITADYPVEQGQFQSYDKVYRPYDVRVTFATGGSAAARAAMIASVKAVAGTTQIFDVITADDVWPSCTAGHFDYRRSATNGLGLLQLTVWLTQIVQTVPGGQFNTQSPSASDPKNDGPVQPETGGTISADNLPSFPGQP